MQTTEAVCALPGNLIAASASTSSALRPTRGAAPHRRGPPHTAHTARPTNTDPTMIAMAAPYACASIAAIIVATRGNMIREP